MFTRRGTDRSANAERGADRDPPDDETLDPRTVDRSADQRDYVPPPSGLGWVRRRDLDDRRDQAAAPAGTRGRYDRSGQDRYEDELHRFVERRGPNTPRRFDLITGRWELDRGGVQFGGPSGDAAPERSHAGRGPRGYRRSDERIREDVCDLLTAADDVDAGDIEVDVTDGVVMLSGTVDSRFARRRAEDLAASVNGVTDVQNRLRAAPAPPERDVTLL